MQFKRDKFVLSTGKEICANNLIVGIGIDEDGSDPYNFTEGYDGGFSMILPWMKRDEYSKRYLSKTEALEVCDAMIYAWKVRRKAIKALDDATHG